MMKKYAMIIGIELYPEASGQETVHYAQNDAREIAAYAKHAGFELIGKGPILDEHANYSNILENLDDMFSRVYPDEFVLLYYAGHGHFSQYGGFLIPHDFCLDNEKNESTCISFDSINKRLNQRKPAKFVFFLDTCHSGSAVRQIDLRGSGSKTGRLKTKIVSEKNKRQMKAHFHSITRDRGDSHFTGRVVFTSSGALEPSRGIEDFKHGMFTHFLLQHLENESHQPEISIETLIQLTKKDIIRYSKRIGLKQTPVVSTNIHGEFYIPTYKKAETSQLPLAVKSNIPVRFAGKVGQFQWKWLKSPVVLLSALAVIVSLSVSLLIQKTGPQFGLVEGVETRGGILIAFDNKGNQWRKKFDSKISRSVVADIDDDGEKDVLVGLADEGNDSGQVIAFNPGGNEKWRYACNSTIPYYGATRGKFRVFDLKVFPQYQDKLIAVLMSNGSWFQSVLTVLNHKGQRLKELWHPGHLYQVERIKETFIVRAVNNDLRRTSLSKFPNRNFSVLFGVKLENIFGQAPPYFGIIEKNTRFDWYYVLSDQEESFRKMEMLEKKVRISVSCGIIFYFDDTGRMLQGGRADGYNCKETINLLRLNLVALEGT